MSRDIQIMGIIAIVMVIIAIGGISRSFFLVETKDGAQADKPPSLNSIHEPNGDKGVTCYFSGMNRSMSCVYRGS